MCVVLLTCAGLVILRTHPGFIAGEIEGLGFFCFWGNYGSALAPLLAIGGFFKAVAFSDFL